jgi:threonine/homoserine/homoserine lactone efflux protein
LFLIFVFGPCEPMIPLVMAPGSPWGIVLVSLTFTLVTLAVMLSAVLAATFGLKRVSLRPLERWSHAMAGAVILACGVAIHLGL